MNEDIKAKALDIQSLLDYQKDSVVSREVKKRNWEPLHSLPLIKARDCPSTQLLSMQWFR
jgi:hypothetical protein